MTPHCFFHPRKGPSALMLAGALAACAAEPRLPPPAPLVAAGPITRLDAVERAWRDAEVARRGAIWRAQSEAGGDPAEAAWAAYHLALATADPAWSNAAVDAFDDALETRPEDAPTRAGLGAARGLFARDYPVNGMVIALVPGPGFARLGHVRASFKLLNEAVEAAPDDPVVRLMRASTFLEAPGVFGGRETGLADYALLSRWTAAPESNPAFAETLRTPAWIEAFHLARARSMEVAERTDEARESWRALATGARDPVLAALAREHLDAT